MKITSKIIGSSLMFALTVGDKNRTEPPVQTLANLRRLMAAKHDQAAQHQHAHQEAHGAIRAALQANRSTAAARAQVVEAEQHINAGMVEINELQDMVDQVTAATVDHDAQALTRAAHLVIDQSLAPFDLSQLDTANESAS